MYVSYVWVGVRTQTQFAVVLFVLLAKNRRPKKETQQLKEQQPTVQQHWIENFTSYPMATRYECHVTMDKAEVLRCEHYIQPQFIHNSDNNELIDCVYLNNRNYLK